MGLKVIDGTRDRRYKYSYIFDGNPLYFNSYVTYNTLSTSGTNGTIDPSSLNTYLVYEKPELIGKSFVTSAVLQPDGKWRPLKNNEAQYIDPQTSKLGNVIDANSSEYVLGVGARKSLSQTGPNTLNTAARQNAAYAVQKIGGLTQAQTLQAYHISQSTASNFQPIPPVLTLPTQPDPLGPDPNTAGPDPTDPTEPTTEPNADQGLQSLSTLTAEEGTGEYSGPTRSYRYPLNPDPSNDYDYLKISVLKYVRTGFPTGTGNFSPESVNTRITESIANVILPMQPNISDSNSVDWGSDQLNPLQARFGGIAMNAISEAGNDVGKALRNFGNDIYDVAKDFTSNQQMPSFIAAYFAGQAVNANLLTRGTGMVVNPNLELLFRGPRLRTFRYSYRLTPREKREAEHIKGIITLFKREMAVKRTSDKMFLTTPNVFKLQYLYKGSQPHPYLNIIKPCALTNFNVSYTPDGTYMTYADGGSMTSYQIDLEFSELEPIYKDDYDDEDSKKSMGY
jgi:hypothetical protein